MNKTKMIDELSARTGESKAAVERVINGMQDLIIEQLIEGNRVSIRGLASWEAVAVSARTMTNPRTGEVTHVPEHQRVVIRAASKLNDAANRCDK